MAMNGDALGTAIKDALASAGHPVGDDEEDVWQVIGTAIVNYISTNADITITAADGGLQEVPGTPPSPCLGPASPKTLSGAIS